jgi:hypothetical protein
MSSIRKISILLGVFFLIALVASGTGALFIDPLIGSSDYLNEISAHKNQAIVGLLIEFICGIAVVGIAVTAFRVLIKYNVTVARWYQGIRIFEATITAVFVMAGFLLITLSQEYVRAGAPDAPYFRTMGSLLMEARFWGYRIYIITVSFAVPGFYYALHKAKLLPRFITVWGLIGTFILLTGCLFHMFGYAIREEMYGSVLGLNELVLAIWLIAKGFNQAAADSEPAKDEEA